MPPPPPPPPPPSPPPPPPPPPPAPAAGKGSNRTLIIVLCIVGALFLIIGGCVATCAYVGYKKAKEYSQQAERNPQLAAISLAAAVHPDLQVVSKDEASGKITLRNKKTGKVVALDTTQFTTENVGEALEQVMRGQQPAVTPSAPSEEAAPVAGKPEEAPTEPAVSPAQAANFASTVKQFPVYVSVYPGGTTTDASVGSFGGMTIGSYQFTTTDKPEAVVDFYEKKITAAGFTVAFKNATSDSNGPSATLAASQAEGQRNFTVNAETDSGRTNVTVGFTSTKP